MTAHQQQIRRDTNGNLAASTPALAELGFDITNERIIAGNGTDMGGVPHINFRDELNGSFSYVSAGGTGNAITITLPISPGSYAGGLKFRFKATANNSGATTINVNGLGAKNLQKYTAGTLGALASGDIVNGGVYEVVYDGTQFQLLTIQRAGITSVSQGNLNTSTQAFSATPATLLGGAIYYYNSAIVMSGGSYGFRLASGSAVAPLSGWWEADTLGGSYSATAWSNSTGQVVNGNQRYITSSPPFELEPEQQAHGFVFLCMKDGVIEAMSSSDVPPWAYNGPTNIRADKICPNTGKKFVWTKKKRTLEEYMDGASIEYELQEITMSRKNADMDLIPHPFKGISNDRKVIMLDPTDDRIAKLLELQNSGETNVILDAIAKDYIRVDNDEVNRKCPLGVKMHRMKFKYTGK